MADLAELEGTFTDASVKAFSSRLSVLYGNHAVGVAAEKLAALCSFPRILTPDLVGYLRDRFLRDEAPWELESDLLLNSEFCSPVGREQFVMHETLRRKLQDCARAVLPEDVLRDIQYLITDYVDELARAGRFLTLWEAQWQRFWAMTLTFEGRTVVTRELAKALHSQEWDNNIVWSAISELLEPLGNPTELQGLLSCPIRQGDRKNSVQAIYSKAPEVIEDAKFRITGGRKLRGDVDVGGSKNSALAIMSSVVLTEGTTILHNVPDVADTRIKGQLLERFGAKVNWHEGSLIIDCSECCVGEADEEMVRSIRTSFYLLGPLLARTGEVTLPAPGGCKIGARPFDYHLKGLRALGAEIELDGGVYRARAQNLHGASIYLDTPSAGATQHLMATATLAQGITTIQNAAMEPEVIFLAAFLNRMGARIEGAGTPTVTIRGVRELQPCTFRVPADRLQAGTYMIAAAITQGDVTVRGILPDNQTALVNKLQEAGADVSEGADWIRVVAGERLRGIKVKTMPYPGFPTDMQQPLTAALTLADGLSTVEETIYESRTGHIQELNKMGANIQMTGKSAVIIGVERLHGSEVTASDLRAGAALVLAGLAAEGDTVVKDIRWIDRGYEKLDEILTHLGGRIERVTA